MKKSLIIGACLFLAACAATPIVMQPTGGSRADGTVEMSYTYGMFEQPAVSIEQGRQSAAQRCAVWGYSGAEPFGGQKQICQQMTQYGCAQTLVTVEYQCTSPNPIR